MNKLRNLRRKEETKITIKNVKVSVRRLWLVMLTFIFATFAWMAYMRYLQPNALIHVAAWKIEFIDDTGQEISNSVDINVENLYPGMDDYNKTIYINNLGEKDSDIDYNITELNLLGNVYNIKNEGEEEESDSEYTIYKKTVVENGIKKVTLFNNASKYPFEIYIENNTLVEAETQDEEGNFKITVNWPYEITGTESQIKQKDELDTLWGYNISKYYKSLQNEDKYALKISLDINAKQKME